MMEAIWTCPDCGKSPTVMPCPDCSKLIKPAFDMLPKVQVGAQVGQEVRAALEDSGWRVETLKAVEIIKELQSPAKPMEAKPLTEKHTMTQNDKPTQEENYDVTEFMLPKHVNKDVVARYGKECVIIGPGGVNSGVNEETGEAFSKLYVDVEFPGEKKLELRLNKANIKELVEDLGSTDRRAWVGARLKLSVKEKNNFTWVEATVLSKPAPKTEA